MDGVIVQRPTRRGKAFIYSREEVMVLVFCQISIQGREELHSNIPTRDGWQWHSNLIPVTSRSSSELNSSTGVSRTPLIFVKLA